MELIDRITAQVSSGSMSIHVPATMVKILGWKKGDVIAIFKEGNKLIYQKEEAPDANNH